MGRTAECLFVKKKSTKLHSFQMSPFLTCIFFSRRSEAEDSHSQSIAQGKHNTFVLNTRPILNWSVGHGYRLLPFTFSFSEILFSSVVSPQNPRILLLDEATRWWRNSFRIQWTKRFTARLIRSVWTLWWHFFHQSSVRWMLKMNYWCRKPWSVWWRVIKTNGSFCLFCSEKTIAQMFTISYFPKEEQLWLSLTACPPSRTLTLSLYWASSM